jgi:phosphoglucosamine mutase
LQACVRHQQTVAQLMGDMVLFPQVLLNVRLKPGQDWRSNSHLTAETQVVEQLLQGVGRVLIRPSGTEPLLRIMVEAQDADLAQACAQRLVAAVLMA